MFKEKSMLWDKYPQISEKMYNVEQIIRLNLKCRSKPFEELLKNLSNSGGKRLRPAFTILSAGFGNKQDDKIYNAAAGIEILHMATLIHDDIIDDAGVRRGKATVNSLYGDKMAVYTGDYLLTRAVMLLSSSLPEDRLNQIAKGIKSICEAEVEQFFSRFNLNLSLFTYLKRIGRKTSALFSFACGEGAFLSNCDHSYQRNLIKFGFYYGMAFQMYDDILNLTGNVEKTGKPKGNDILEGVITIPFILALRKSTVFTEKMQKTILGKAIEYTDVISIIDEIIHLGGIDDTKKWINRYLQKARDMLEPLPSISEKEILYNAISNLES